MKKLMTICLLIAILFTSNVYSQEKRDNRELTFLQYIATNSSNTIIKYMEFIYQLFNKNLTKFPYLFNLAYVQVTNIVKLID